MYEEYFHLKADPFPLSPDGKQSFGHTSYKKARFHIEYALHRGEGIVLVTGEPGTGKTTLIKELVRFLGRSKTNVVSLTCNNFSGAELMMQFGNALGIERASLESPAALLDIERKLCQSQKAGRRTLLVLDEAQSLSVEALEQARLISNLQADDWPIVQILLVGQPALRQKVLSPALTQLHQRIVTTGHLQPLNINETKEYVLNRLVSVDWHQDPEIEECVFDAVFNATNGIPRWINQVGSRLLLHAMLEEKHTLTMQDIESVLKDLAEESLLPKSALHVTTDASRKSK